MLTHRSVQAKVMFSHGEALAARNFVQTHGDFHEHAVQGEKSVEHLSRIGLAGRAIARLAPFLLMGHGIYSDVTNSRSQG